MVIFKWKEKRPLSRLVKVGTELHTIDSLRASKPLGNPPGEIHKIFYNGVRAGKFLSTDSLKNIVRGMNRDEALPLITEQVNKRKEYLNFRYNRALEEFEKVEASFFLRYNPDYNGDNVPSFFFSILIIVYPLRFLIVVLVWAIRTIRM